MSETRDLNRARLDLMTLTGATLISLQHLEHLIYGTVVILNENKLKFTIDDFLSDDQGKSQPDLEKQLQGLGEGISLPPDFEARIEQFKESRDRFVRRIFAERLNEGDEFEQIDYQRAFIQNLLDESEVLVGLYSAFINNIIQSIDVDPASLERIRVICAGFDTEAQNLVKNLNVLRNKRRDF